MAFKVALLAICISAANSFHLTHPAESLPVITHGNPPLEIKYVHDPQNMINFNVPSEIVANGHQGYPVGFNTIVNSVPANPEFAVPLTYFNYENVKPIQLPFVNHQEPEVPEVPCPSKHFKFAHPFLHKPHGKPLKFRKLYKKGAKFHRYRRPVRLVKHYY